MGFNSSTNETPIWKEIVLLRIDRVLASGPPPRCVTSFAATRTLGLPAGSCLDFRNLQPSVLGTTICSMPTTANIDDAPERRRWLRCHFAFPIRVTVEKPQHVTLENARGGRMNHGGIEVYANTQLSIGDRAEIELTPPHFYPAVTLRGVVRNRAGNLYGVEFLATNAAEKQQLGLFRKILARWAVDA